jgi:predicted enzyme related to lactoylglutathione lyase
VPDSPIVHFQLTTPNPEQTTAFVRDVFGWEPGPGVAGQQLGLDTGWASDIVVAGSVMERPGAPQASATLFVRVVDLDGTLAKATERGAEVLVPRTDIEGRPTVAVIRAPDGLVFGIVQL